MSKYIWFNPVVKSLNSKQELRKFNECFSLVEVNVEKDYVEQVKEKYYDVISKSKQTVIDMRCPIASQLIKEEYDDGYIFPDIHPILIHCAMELNDKYIKNEQDELIVTTPCQVLADYGNTLKLVNTRFVTWIKLLKEYQYKIESLKILKSPIPPGYFENDKVVVLNLKSKEEIECYFKNKDAHEYDIVEMLYCENGCHNGDGIIES